jgi:hypothetical protein
VFEGRDLGFEREDGLEVTVLKARQGLGVGAVGGCGGLVVIVVVIVDVVVEAIAVLVLRERDVVFGIAVAGGAL